MAEVCLYVILALDSHICTPVLLNLLNVLRKNDKMLSKHRILSLFPKLFNKFNNSQTLM